MVQQNGNRERRVLGVTFATGNLSVAAAELELAGMLKFCNRVESPVLAVAPATIRSVTAAMNVFVTRHALLVQAEETLLSFGQDRCVCVRVTGGAPDLQVPAPEPKLQPLMIIVTGIGNTRQLKTALVCQRKLATMVFAVAFFATAPQCVIQPAMQTGRCGQLPGYRFMAIQTGFRHRLLRRTVAGSTTVRTTQFGDLCVNRRNVPRRSVLQVQPHRSNHDCGHGRTDGQACPMRWQS